MCRKIVVLGSNGFIGKNLCSYFAANRIDETTGFSSEDCNLLSMDEIWKKLSFVSSQDIIIMTSCITRLRENTFDSMIKNIRMADNISNFIENNNVRQFVFLSTVDVYGLVDATTHINEKILPNPNDYYALSKLSSEYILKRTCSRMNIPLLVLRLSGIYGHGDEGKSTINKLVHSATLNKKIVIFGDGKAKRDFVNVEDVCNIIKNAIERKTTSTLNIATGKSHSINEIVEIIRSCCPEEFAINYEQDGSIHEQRAGDMIYDVSLLTSTFPDVVCKDIREGIPIYLNGYIENPADGLA